eukprot:7824816-Pyramimonas_sp.AAC.1
MVGRPKGQQAVRALHDLVVGIDQPPGYSGSTCYPILGNAGDCVDILRVGGDADVFQATK